MPKPQFESHLNGQQLISSAACNILTVITDALEQRGLAHLSLTGGSMGTAVLAELTTLPEFVSLDFSRIHFWWSDERFVATGNHDRNEQQAREALLSKIAVPVENIHVMGAADRFDSPEEAAAAYEADLANFAGEGKFSPVFDLVLLGMGPDGHIASLFPHRREIHLRQGAAVAVHDSPKPPPTRVTLTLPVIQNSRRIWFLISGADKAKATARLRAAAAFDDSELGADILDETPAAGARASYGAAETLVLTTVDSFSG